MTDAAATTSLNDRATMIVPRLFVLELNAGKIHTMNIDGSSRETIVTDCRLPDGITLDLDAGHIYWTNMGVPNLDDGSIERADLDGGNRIMIVPQGHTHTPKQIILHQRDRKLYWCDREGMKVMRANMDGSAIETLVDRGSAELKQPDLTRWCVGIAIDDKTNRMYWTQKGPENGGLGVIYRAGLDIPEGESASARSDIEVFFDGLSEPIDLEIDHERRLLYWTDRGEAPRGNTVSRASIDNKPDEPEIVVRHLNEGIGLALDLPNERMFVTDFAGSLYVAKLDGSDLQSLLFGQGNLTGIAYAEIARKI
ncbi:3-hydroxyacyl-CoA dehydrogenase [Bradyrhizobium sp. USDA 4353]